MATLTPNAPNAARPPDERTYRRRINAWSLYDVANSAFFTTIIAAVLPAYYSAVAGATLPSEALATQRWSLSLSIALFISALLSPVLGTLSDIIRGKKRLLALFTGIGAVACGLLVLVSTGDWFLASVLIVVGRVGAAGPLCSTIRYCHTSPPKKTRTRFLRGALRSATWAAACYWPSTC